MNPPAGASRPGRELALATLFFLAVTVLMTWPQAARLNEGLTDVGDAKLVARILQWDFAQTLRNPVRLFHLDFFHPARYVLAFSENLYGVALFGWPILAAGGSALLNYNVLLLLGFLLSALAAWALARYVTGDPLASIAAGFVYAFLPWRFSQLPHLQFQWGAFLCLLLLFLLRFLDRGRRRDAILFGIAFGWNALANVHFALFSGFLVATTLALHACWGGPERWRRIRGALLAAAAGALAFVPFAIGYRRAMALYGMRRYFGELVAFSGRWGDFLSAGEKNCFWGPLTQKWRSPEGDFFPGLAAAALAIVALTKARRPALPGSGDAALGRRRAARWLDAASLLLAGVWIASLRMPGLRVGPLSLGDPGRVQVFLTGAILVRLILAFPGRRAYANVPDFLSRSRFPPRLVLLVAIVAVGAVVALGAHTPYYRFLFTSFGAVFRAIRAPSRGIVLFDLGLAVLAAWGLALLSRGRRRTARLAIAGAASLVLLVEYRAFPLTVVPVAARAAPVYAWIRGVDFPGAVVEWPLGLQYDFEYVFRQTAHEKPIVNGYSGFFPPGYRQLDALLRERPIPDAVWPAMAKLGGSLLIYHAHETRVQLPTAYADALDRALSSGGLEIARNFPHEGGEDFVFLPASAPRRGGVLRGAAPPPAARAAYDAAVTELRRNASRFAPPFAGIEFPEPVSPGQWHGAWALDDSGIAEIRIASELGPAGSALLHMRMPGLFRAYPDYAEAKDDLGGFGFAIPKLPPGPHTLTLTLVANDGGVTVISRPIVIAPK